MDTNARNAFVILLFIEMFESVSKIVELLTQM